MTGTHLAYIGLACGLGLVACLIYGLCSAAKEGDELVEELLCEHAEEAQEQADAFLDAVRDIAADCLESPAEPPMPLGLARRIHSLRLREECEQIFALDAREPVR